jgi:hypothetical protein
LHYGKVVDIRKAAPGSGGFAQFALFAQVRFRSTTLHILHTRNERAADDPAKILFQIWEGPYAGDTRDGKGTCLSGHLTRPCSLGGDLWKSSSQSGARRVLKLVTTKAARIR